MDNQVKVEPTRIDPNQSNSKCPYCQAKLPTKNELLQERIDDRDTQILNLKQEIQSLLFELNQKNMTL